MIISSLIGDTPLIQVTENIYAKLETTNPSGSVKDRMVSYLISRAIESGELCEKHDTLIEASSGNTGISLSMMGAALGRDVIIIMPQNMSEERKSMMRAYGAEIIEVGDNAFADAISLRDKLLMQNSNYWSPKQFSNPRNIECHFTTTAWEIFSGMPRDKKFEAFIHGAGTGGTMMGIKRFFDRWPTFAYSPEFILVQPAEPASDHGIQGINDGADFLVDTSAMHGNIVVSTNDAIERAKRFATETGLLVGISSGANLLACERYVKERDIEGFVVTILCDRGERYLSIF